MGGLTRAIFGALYAARKIWDVYSNQVSIACNQRGFNCLYLCMLLWQDSACRGWEDWRERYFVLFMRPEKNEMCIQRGFNSLYLFILSWGCDVLGLVLVHIISKQFIWCRILFWRTAGTKHVKRTDLPHSRKSTWIRRAFVQVHTVRSSKSNVKYRGASNTTT